MTKTRKPARGTHATTPEQAGDEKILTLFRQWCELQRQEAKSEELAFRRDAVELQIHHTPATGAVGLAIKGYFLGYYHADADPAIDEAALTYGEDGEIEHWDSRAVKSFVDDAVRVVPELRTFLARIIDAPVRLPPGTDEPKKEAAEFVERGAGGAPVTPAEAHEAWQIVCDMEQDVEQARIFAYGLSILAADSLRDDENLGAFVMQLAWSIEAHCKDIEERRGELFHLLHPSRDKFEKEGWPS